MISRNEFVLKESDIYDPSKHIRMPVLIMYESSSYIKKYRNELEVSLNELVRELIDNDNTKHSIDMALFPFNDGLIERSGHDFALVGRYVDESKTSKIQIALAETKPDLYESFMNSVKLIRIRKRDYKALSLSYYKETIIIISSGKSFTDEMTKIKANRVFKEFVESGAVVIPVLIGDEEVGALEGFSIDGKILRGDYSGISRIFDKLGKSMEYLSASASNKRDSLLSAAVCWEECMERIR